MARPLVIEHAEQFHALGDPTRMRILGLLADAPASVQRLSDRLSKPKGTVAHHVGVLERAGLIRVASRRRVRGVEERVYARTAPRFRLRERARQPADAETRLQMENYLLRHALTEARPPRPGDPSSSVIMRARMPAERARRFARIVEELAYEFSDGAPGTGEMFGFVAAIYVPDWADDDAADAPKAPAVDAGDVAESTKPKR